ncbi:MAG: PilT/PilU family type 4a pilus ATPase [Eubacteriaceae bacterium]|nr:PilT/PilU family type 4a pilus ATPase [Eubacteriaceae bacterium]MDD4507321.1 PilT/PilU family type 4a pilus ATPase [Eubacteriaceae bacterium]
MDIKQILTHATLQKASDVFLVTGLPLTYKVNGQLVHITEKPLMPSDTESLVRGIYGLASGRDYDTFNKNGDDDFSFALPGVSRFRASTYKQRGTDAAVIRIISFSLPDPKAMGIPDCVTDLADLRKGMILVTGPAGSGKSTTMACMIDHINETRAEHIITLEDPLEHLHHHKKSIVSQREIGTDTEDYVTALRAALRQSPDVILLGEMRDHETINVAMTAAETGHLILSTMHTISAADTIDRVVDAFPPNQQNQIAVQLSMCLSAVVSQQLIPSVDHSRLIPAFEVLTVTPGVRNMIRDHKAHQIGGLLYSSTQPDMFSMDTYLYNLVTHDRITAETAISHAVNPAMLEKKLQ